MAFFSLSVVFPDKCNVFHIIFASPRSRQFATGGSNNLPDWSTGRYDSFIVDWKRSKV